MKRNDPTRLDPKRGDPSIALPREGTWRRRFLALSAALLVTACSAIKLGYNNADTLAVYSLDSYFALDDAQSEMARGKVRELLRWHRQTQLAGYVELLQRAQARVGGKVTAEEVLAFQREVNARLLMVGERAAPELAPLALRLQPAQVDRFAAKLADSNAKARRELARLGDNELDARVKRYAERMQEWFGPLTEAQLELVRAAHAQRADGSAWWRQERDRRQRDAVEMLRRIQAEQPNEATVTQWLRAYFAELHEPRDPGRRARVLEARAHNAELVAQLLSTATPTQRTAIAKKLRGYADDFTTLAGEGVRQPG